MSKIAQYSDIIDRSLDRWENAFEAARAATYSPGQFAQDMAESWADWALYTAMPLSCFGLDISARPAVPTVEFIVTDNTVPPMTQMVRVPQINNVTAAASPNLNRPGTTTPPLIPAANVITTLAGMYLKITLDVPGIAALTGMATVTANVYSGDVLGTGPNVAIAHVKVVWLA